MEESLYMQLNHCFNLMHRYQSLEYAQIPQGQGKVLRILGKHGSLSQKELAACLQIRPASLSELISKLEAKGYVQKNTDGADKRIYRINLTPEGRKEAKKLHDVAARAMQKIFAALSSDEKKEMSRLACRLISSLETDEENKQIHVFCEECGLCTNGYIKRL